MRKWEREVLKIARELGATDLRIIPGGKHAKIVGKWNGVEFWRAIPGTPGDKRTLVHTRTGIERAMRRAAGETVSSK